MPNWAGGSLSITGTKANVINFASRFIYDDDQKDETELRKRKFFARSFTFRSRQSVLDEIENEFSVAADNTKMTFSLYVDFAWSAGGCLIDWYPIRSPNECITLMDACKADHVAVELATEESGMCFEEYITCDIDGNYTYESKDMPEYECPDCGEHMCCSSKANMEECECYECGKIGLIPSSETNPVGAIAE